MTLEAEILASAEKLLVENEPQKDLLAQAFAWLRAPERAEPLFVALTADALAQNGEERAFRGASLAFTMFTCRFVAHARALAEEIGQMPLGSPNPDVRTRIGVEIASAFESTGQRGRSTVPLSIAGETVRESSAGRRSFLLRMVLDLMTQTKHRDATATLAFAQPIAGDLFWVGDMGRFETRLGQLDRAWARTERLLGHVGLAVLLGDLMDAAPDATDRLRDVLAQIENGHERGTMLISAARGIAHHPDHVSSTIELLDEGLARVADASPRARYSAMVRASEVFAEIGELGRAARLARESLECMSGTSQEDFSHNFGSTGRALARAGERAAAHRLYLEKGRSATHWSRALLIRDIAFSFPEPPEEC